MRLWHVDLIPYLPKKQLVAQWRELNSIFKNQPKHILINYVYNYTKEYLLLYTQRVMDEMRKRGYKYKSMENFNNYFQGLYVLREYLIYPEHNYEYLEICFYNLKEKYIRGQKDFTGDIWKKLKTFFIEESYYHNTYDLDDDEEDNFDE